MYHTCVDWDALCLRLLTADWEPLYSSAAIDDKLAAFMDVWNAAVDELCPVVTVSRRRPDCPWLRDDPDIDTATEERDTARRTWERTRTPEARRDYQLSRNRLKGIFTRAKRSFLCDGLLSDRRGFWSRIKSFALRPAAATPTGSDVTDRADDFNAYLRRSALGSPPRSPAPVTSILHPGRPVCVPPLWRSDPSLFPSCLTLSAR